MIINTQHSNMLISPARSIVARVEHYQGSSLRFTFNHNDVLKSIIVSRGGGNKFFGFGVCQEIEVKVLHKEMELQYVEGGDTFKVSFGVNGDYVYPLPTFIVSPDINVDKISQVYTFKAYDALYKAANYTVADLELPSSYTIGDVADAIASYLGLSGVSRININESRFSTSYANGANFSGSETLRVVLDAIAEATQTIYYVDSNDNLVFRMLDRGGNADLVISKANYFTLDMGENCRLSDIASVTDLGDNVTATVGQAPSVSNKTQYIRNNPFWDLRDDINTLIQTAIDAIGTIHIRAFECKWRGNYLLEPGDKLEVDGLKTYLLSEKYTYSGGLSAETQWQYADNEAETPSNPVTVGDTLKQTVARVDKANQTITLAIEKTEGYDSRLTALELNSESITASVQKSQEATNNKLDAIEGEIETLTNRVEATMTPEAIEIKIQEAIGDGVNQVTTETGFTFNNDGLTVSKSGSEMTTTITEDGMIVYKDGEEVLTADNTGVKAIDLTAATYLHIGTYSRFQDYGEGRTGCFWII